MKTVEGRVVGSYPSLGLEHVIGSVDLRTSEGRMKFQVTGDTIGSFPPDGTYVRVEYQEGATPIALRIEHIGIGEINRPRIQLRAPSIAGPPVDDLKLPNVAGSFRWPEACAACGTQENLTRYNYRHSTERYMCTGYSRGTVEYRLPVRAYLCQGCKTLLDEKYRRPQIYAGLLTLLGIVLGLIIPFVPGFLQTLPLSALFWPPIHVALLYVIIGLPGLWFLRTNDRAEHPWLDYIGIRAPGVFYSVMAPEYRIALKSPEFRDLFIRLNGWDRVAREHEFSGTRMNISYICGCICCSGVIFPLVAVFIARLLT